ncbi:MAG: hypothetical protein PHR32_09300, partial [Candidatus Cloacimonetes bacterium]|nr:hypothetical protein [Candidatus Cloacimonadota bacterium]
TGVRFADADTDLDALKEEISSEVAENSRFFPESVLTKDEYVVRNSLQVKNMPLICFTMSWAKR